MRSRWRRHRRLLAAGFAAAAMAFGLLAARPHPSGTRRDSGLAGGGPRADGPHADGRQAGGPAGDRAQDGGARDGGPAGAADPGAGQPGTVATPIRLADAAVAGLLHPGERVDVLATRAEQPGPARVIATAVPVVSVPRPSPEAAEGGIIVVRTVRERAGVLARAAADSRISIAIVG